MEIVIHPRSILGPGRFAAWNGALWLGALLFGAFPAATLFARALRAVPQEGAAGVPGCIVLIVGYFALATAIGAGMAAHAVRCPGWLAGLVAGACLVVVVVGLSLVLVTTADLGGVPWVVASAGLMLALHAANLAMSAVCEQVRRLAGR